MTHNETEEDFVSGVVNAVTEKEGVKADELEKPLGSVIDAEALHKLVESMSSGPVSFEYHRYDLTVAHDRSVSIGNPTECCSS